jgi:ubiquinone/menaquinone biosynthesis C-methylase UbiE
MGLRKNLFAATYDSLSRKSEEAGLRDIRHGLIARADGLVLEVGAGTGANLPHYGGSVESLVLTEPEPAMLRRLQRKATDLPFEDGSFDTVVSTLVLCGVDDQQRAVREIRRVLRPGGRLLFLEHVRSDDPSLARLQDRLNWLNRLVVSCDCNRATLSTIEAADFSVSSLEHGTIPRAPKFVRPLIVGTAVAD